MRKLYFAIAVALFSAESMAEFDVYGFAAARVGYADARSSWLDGGFGRFDQDSSFAILEGQLAVDWNVSERIQVRTQSVIRADSARSSTENIGLIEAFVSFQMIDKPANLLSVNVGQKFFPSSFENTEDLWQSKYTLSYSVWNSWIAQEFRPIGVDVRYTHIFPNSSTLGFQINAFIGNDSSGAQLAWGGFKHSQRLTVLGEKIPLPPLISLGSGGNFRDQRIDGTKPFGADLDDKVGYATQLSFKTNRFSTKVSYVDNNGDRQLYRGEYAWRTKFAVAGFNWQISKEFELLGEVAVGETGMGPIGTSVDVDFDTFYLMLSWQRGSHRISSRIDDFQIEDRDGIVTDNSEDGRSYTLAYLYEPGSWRLGIEYIDTSADRIAAFQSGFSLDNDGQQVSIELRYIL